MAKKVKKNTKTKEKSGKVQKAITEEETTVATTETPDPIDPQKVAEPAEESKDVAVEESASIVKTEKAGAEKSVTPKAEKTTANDTALAEEKINTDAVMSTLTMQYGDRDIDVKALVQAAKDDFKANHKRTILKELNLYLKPEDSAMYYVANGSVEGKIEY